MGHSQHVHEWSGAKLYDGNNDPGHSQHIQKMVWEIVPEIHIWSGARSCYGSNSPGHSQHIQKWSGKLFLRLMYGLEQDCVMARVWEMFL